MLSDTINSPKITIITGKVGSGKSTLLKKVAGELKKEGEKPSGIIAPAVYKAGKKIGYDAIDIAESGRWVLSRKDKKFKGGFSAGPYNFSPTGFSRACKSLLNYCSGGIVFLDEAGPLELAGKGYVPVIEKLLDSPLKEFFIVVRASCLEDFKKTFLSEINEENLSVIYPD